MPAGMIRQMPSADITSAPTSAALARSREVLAQVDATSATASTAVARARAITAIVASLTDDIDILVGSTLAPLLIADVIDDERATALGGADATRIATELRRLG